MKIDVVVQRYIKYRVTRLPFQFNGLNGFVFKPKFDFVHNRAAKLLFLNILNRDEPEFLRFRKVLGLISVTGPSKSKFLLPLGFGFVNCEVMKKFWTVLFFYMLVAPVQSGAVPYGNNLFDLLGESILHPEIHEWMEAMRSEHTNEKLEPNVDLYSLEFRDQGIALDFTINFHLSGIRLFDSGRVYHRYALPLPNNLEFNMNIEDLLASDPRYVYKENNPYELVGRFNDITVVVYMRDNRIEMVHIKPEIHIIRSKEVDAMKQWKYRLMPDGECLQGSCYDSIGTMDWGEGVVKFTGNWEYGIPNGQGVYLDSMGHAYKGGFLMGYFWGNGIFREDGFMDYEGEFRMGTRTGSGTAVYSNGYRYSGEWLNDLFHGEGTYHQQQGYVYKGHFTEGKFNGHGQLTTPFGYYEGDFKNGLPHGSGEQYVKETKTTLRGTWVNGKKEGEFKFMNSNGSQAIIYFENDVQVSR